MMSTDSKGGVHEIHSKFQVADVTRALWSVALICDSGLKVDFATDHAVIKDKSGKELCVFERRGGLYVAQMKLKKPPL